MNGVPRRRVNIDAMPWRPLLSDPGAEWAGLPLMTRAVAMEIMRRLDADFCIVRGSSETLFDAVCVAIGAGGGKGSQGRKHAREALRQLASHRWVTLSSDTLCAYFPDLNATEKGVGRTRPARIRCEESAFTTHKSQDVVGESVDLSPVNEAKSSESFDTDHGSRVEKSRVEKKREDARAREPVDPPGELGREVARLQAAVKLVLNGRGAPADLTSANWRDVATWCRSMVTPTRTLDEVHAHLARGFASDPKAAKAGWSTHYLAKNPNEYFVRLVGESGVPRTGYVTPADASEHVETTDEEFEFALRGGKPS